MIHTRSLLIAAGLTAVVVVAVLALAMRPGGSGASDVQAAPPSVTADAPVTAPAAADVGAGTLVQAGSDTGHEAHEREEHEYRTKDSASRAPAPSTTGAREHHDDD